MKKVLIVSDSTRVGGIQKSLINMLDFIDYSKYSVSLLLFDDSNLDEINKNVNILPSSNALRIVGCTSNSLKKKSLFKFFIRKILSILCLIFGSSLIFSLLFKKIKVNDKYDIAISYSNNVNSKSLYFGFNKFVLEKVDASKKKCWIHIDYKSRHADDVEINEFKKMDQIVLVSEACKKNFDLFYPEFKDKTTVVYNYLNKEKIMKMSNMDNKTFDNSCFNILSIGRIEENKNIESQLLIAKALKDRNLNFKWYVIGNGVDYLKIKNKITELKIEDRFILLGEKKNVYPYIKTASLLVSTSLSESFGLTIAEALILDVPVVALNYPAVKEIVSNDYIFNNLEQMGDKISLLIGDNSEYKKYRKDCHYLINNETIKSQINKVLGD